MVITRRGRRVRATAVVLCAPASYLLLAEGGEPRRMAAVVRRTPHVPQLGDVKCNKAIVVGRSVAPAPREHSSNGSGHG
ncbi:MAG: hypothetical protein ACR2JO_09440 [Mycobacteriales bacterium]